MEVASEPKGKSDFFIIRASDVPPDFFENRDVAKRYFRRFGKVKLISFKPKRNCLLVEYANEDSMLNALEVGGEFHGHVFNITRESIVRKKKMKKDPDPDWEDPELTAELAAMGAFGPTRTYDLRGEGMELDQIKPKLKKWGSPKPQKRKVAEKQTNFSSEENELLQIIKQQAVSVDDKFRILDARDKLIRIRLKKTIELTKARATIGTCPDMCPEKERLLRQIQHQVALYEQDVSGMNPRFAVKQYSRSSADQEAPLPSELRPVATLQMTMGYLMHRIIQMCESSDVNLAEWFHYLWDRTRGIRKDITQQELCCQGSVELVEQCARFHIFCSARLVAEDVTVFDQKINTENLTKCLQTLKYMYHDLQLKGESCENEAEFRAYIILLNLNDGNFMWEVQHLKPSIQQSPEVKFALAVHSSLDKHNYVQFFKHVRSTSFLNACILMRYFTQIRISAMKTILKSYSPRVSQTSLPIQYLTKILAFEDAQTTIEFFESYNLYTDVDRSRLVLDKVNFGPPEFPYVLDRAIRLVESKRQKSIGETICGKPLPPKLYETHEIEDSFDTDGYLKSTEQMKKSQEPIKKIPMITEPIRSDITISSSVTEVPLPMDTIDAPLEPPVIFKPTNQGSLFQNRVFTPISKPIVSSNIFTPPVVPIVEIKKPPVVIPTVDLKKEEEEKARRLRLEQEAKIAEERQRELARVELEKKRKRKLDEELKRRIEEEERLERQRKKIEIDIGVKSVMNDLLNFVELEVKRSTLIRIRTKICERRIKKAFQKWREFCRRKRKRKVLDFSPLWPRSVEEEVDQLQTKSQKLVLENMKRYKRGKPLEVNIGDDVITPIDLHRISGDILRKKSFELNKLQNEIFWKVTISLPNETEMKCGLNFLEKILDNFIKWDKNYFIQQNKNGPTVTYCLEKQKGLVIGTRNETNGFIFIANEINQNLIERIKKNFIKLKVAPPTVIIVQNFRELDTNLKEILDESPYLILVDHLTGKKIPKSIEEGISFLATKIQKSPDLELNPFKQFLVENLITNFYRRAKGFAKFNSNYGNCLKNPNTVIKLHNEAITRLKQIIAKAANTKFQKFPQVFMNYLQDQTPSLPCDYKFFPTFWDSPTYLNKINSVLSDMLLPELKVTMFKSQLDLEVTMSNYCQGFLRQSQKCFFKAMSALLKSKLNDAIWTDVIEILLNEKLDETDFSLYGTGFVNTLFFQQLIVVYDVTDLNEFVKSDWFYVGHSIIKREIVLTLYSVEKREESVDLDEILKKVQSPKSVDVDRWKNEFSNCKKLIDDLEDSVVVHKRILEKSGLFLKNMLEQ